MGMIPIYDALVTAGVAVENHYSDLYFPVNDVTTEIVRQYYGPVALSKFISEIDRKPWYEIPFAYMPYWRARA